MSSSTPKKAPKANMDDVHAALQALITQAKKDGMIRASDLNAQLEKMQLTPEKIEDIYDRLDAMNIQVVTADLELDLGTTISTWGRTTISIWQALTRRSWSTPLTWPPSTVWTTRCGCTSRRSARSSSFPLRKRWSWPSASPRGIRKRRTSSPRRTCVWWSPSQRNIPAAACTFWT